MQRCVRGAQVALSACQRKDKRSDTALLPWASSSLNVLSSVLMTFFLRKRLFLANLSVCSPIKLFRE